MTVKIKPRRLSGTIEAPSSKSSVQRLAICAMLSDGATKIYHNSTAKDVKAVFRCISALGADTTDGDGYTVVTPTECPAKAELFCGESGAVSRFLTPVAAAVCPDVSIDGAPGLRARPFTDLIEVMRAHGADIDSDSLPFRIRGSIAPGDYVIRGDVSSQYISGLLMALPKLGGQSTLTVTGNLQSEGYIEMTLAALRLFDVNIARDGRTYMIEPAKFVSPGEIRAEGDWSGAAYILACGKDVSVDGLDVSSLQRDRAIAPLLDSIRNLNGDKLTIDVGDIPDLVPAIAAASATCNGTVEIVNAGRLRVKESDRLETTRSVLAAMGADISMTTDSMTINGVRSLHGATVDSHNDHRIAMAAAVACASAAENGTFDGELIITNAEAINKSYPKYFDDYAALGGEIEYEL